MIGNLKAFSQVKSSLREELDELHTAISQSGGDGHEKFAADILQIIQRLSSDSFKVLVVGEFSTGKSTFLNALIGDKFLPTETTETTATINVIRYGKEPKAVLHFWGERDTVGQEISPGKQEEIQLENLVRYVTSLTSESNEIAKTLHSLPAREFLNLFF